MVTEDSLFWPAIKPLVERRVQGESWLSIFYHEFRKDWRSFPNDNCSKAVDYHRRAGLSKIAITLIDGSCVGIVFGLAAVKAQPIIWGIDWPFRWLFILLAMLVLGIAAHVAAEIPRTFIYMFWVWRRRNVLPGVESMRARLESIPERWIVSEEKPQG